MLQKNHKRLGEKGFASIAIALVLIAVLALLTIGFAQLARREQQNALNKQLARQAFYAAESGINDANKAIQDGALDATWVDNHGGADQCLPLPLPGTGPADISTQDGVSYKCVLVDLRPKTLVKDIGSDGDWSAYFTTEAGTPDRVTLGWSSLGNKPLRNSGEFEPAPSWDQMAVMQFSITPVTSSARDQLINDTFTVYGYPSAGAGSVPYSSALGAQGKVVDGNCTAADSSCRITITGLPGANTYIVHAHAYYDSTHFTIQPSDGPTALGMKDAQVVIDVTGKAREVLKRIRVHVPINPPKGLPGGNALDARNICKRFTTDPLSDSQNAFGSLGYPPDTTVACDVTN